MSQPVSINSLFQSSADDGNISHQSMQILNMMDVGNQIQNQIGVQSLNVKSSELILVATMIDDSGSIAASGNTDAVIDGHNGTIDALLGSKQADEIEFYTQYLNGFVLNNWVNLSGAVRLDHNNYNPMLGTPLYDNSIVLLGGVMARLEWYRQQGQVPRAGVLIVTDGADLGSRKAKASDVKAVVNDLMKDEMGLVAFLGVDDGYTNFTDVARSMGISDNWILTVKSDPTQIRRAFNMFSSSMVRGSQNSGAFSAVAMQGFMSNATP